MTRPRKLIQNVLSKPFASHILSRQLQTRKHFHLLYHSSQIPHGRRKVLNMGAGGRARFRKNIGGGGKRFAGCKLIGAPAPSHSQILTISRIKLVHLRSNFYCFTWTLKEKERVGELLGGGAKGMLAPSKIIGVGLPPPPPPLPTPMYPIYVMCKVFTRYHGTSEIEHGLCACR